MKWLFLLVLPLGLIASTQKVLVFDYGGVIARANYEPLHSFLKKTVGLPDVPLEKIKESLNKPASYWEDYAGRQMSKTWATSFEQNQNSLILPTQGMDKLVRALKKKGHRVALLSNTSNARAIFLKERGQYALFHPVLLSCDLGVKKPEKKIYKILLNNIDASPQNCLFIDNKESNVKVAIELGMDGIVFRSATELKTELIKRGITL